jgi:hypothetical protein
MDKVELRNKMKNVGVISTGRVGLHAAAAEKCLKGFCEVNIKRVDMAVLSCLAYE